jgi:hypothetical protein
MGRIPNLLGEESRSGWPIEEAGIAEIDSRFSDMALALHGNALEPH